MERLPSIGVAAALAVAIVISLPGGSHGPSSGCRVPVLQEQQNPGVGQVVVPQVAVRASVLLKGKPLAGLTEESFSVQVGSNSETVARLKHARSEPLVIGIVAELSGTRRDQMMGAEHEPIRSFLRTVMRPGDKASIGLIYRDRFSATAWTSNLTEAVKWVDEALANSPYGSSLVFDSLQEMCKRLAAEPGNRVLVIATDGADNASGKKGLEKAIEAALRGTVAIHVVLVTHTDRSLVRGMIAREQKRGKTAAKQLAESTGGWLFHPATPADVAAAYGRIAALLEGDYLITVAPGKPNDGKLRKVRVTVAVPEAEVHHAAGYYAPKD